MQFSDLALSRRLERAEGAASREFAGIRRRRFPSSEADWQEIGGAYAVFDTPESPVTQAFGLGLFEPLTPAILEQLESFFYRRGTFCDIELSPFAGVDAIGLITERGYHPT